MRNCFADLSLEYDDSELYKSFVEFYNDVVPEFKSVGRVVQFKVCCNHEPHLRGNVYIQFSRYFMPTRGGSRIVFHPPWGRWSPAHDFKLRNKHWGDLEKEKHTEQQAFAIQHNAAFMYLLSSFVAITMTVRALVMGGRENSCVIDRREVTYWNKKNNVCGENWQISNGGGGGFIFLDSEGFALNPLLLNKNVCVWHQARHRSSV